MFSFNYCVIFKNPFFEKHLQTVASAHTQILWAMSLLPSPSIWLNNQMEINMQWE